MSSHSFPELLKSCIIHGAEHGRKLTGELAIQIHVLGVIMNIGNGVSLSEFFVWNLLRLNFY